MESEKMSFSVNADNIAFKRILNDSFISLSVKAISTINPNLNGTYFTKEALEDAIPTFRNKPVLGSFEWGDFGSHDGDYRKDDETGVVYWDTSGQGERVLGTIRESDDVKVVHEDDGLDWLELTCVLWTRYAYKQVKRLLKDAARNKNGGKSVSVEIDVLSYKEDPKTKIKQIDKFSLDGITILGSKFGREVEPGIPGASASLLASFEKANFASQMSSLRQAYALLDGKSDVDKKESDKMEKEEKQKEPTEKDKEAAKASEQCAAPNKPAADKPADDLHMGEPDKCAAPAEGKKPDGDPKEGDKSKDEKDPKKAKMSSDGEPEGHDPEEDHDEDGTKAIAALASLTSESTWRIHSYDEVIERFKDTKAKGADLVIATLNRMKASGLEEIKELALLLAKVSAPDFVDNPDDVKAEEEFAKDASCLALHNEVCEAKAKCAASDKSLEEANAKCAECLAKEKESDAKMSELQTKCSAFEKKEFLGFAKDTMGKCGDLPKDVLSATYADCESGKIADMDALKSALGMAYVSAKEKKTNDTYSAPITKVPSTPSFNSAAEAGKNADVFAKLDAYVHNN